MEEVEIREMNGEKGMGPRSVSQYDDTFHSMSAHEALKDAANQLFPLADYMEDHFIPSDPTTEMIEHHCKGYLINQYIYRMGVKIQLFKINLFKF